VGWVWRSQGPVLCPARRPLPGLAARRSIHAALLALACGLLVSCGGEPILAPPADSSRQMIVSTPKASAATPMTTSAAPRIGDIVWATSTDPATNAPIAPVSIFRPDAPQIVAAVHVDALPAGSSVVAMWEYNDTSLDAFTTQLSLSDSGSDQWIGFYIERDPDVEWPVGTYEVNISVNGAAVRQAAVEVHDES
jgi:hypothetical protein